jgi:putative transposase
MARPRRCDRPRALHHVTNRAHGHRPLFDGEADVRVFLGLLARAVRKGLLEVHAYCVLATHFHLLVSSQEGTIAEGLGWVEDLYARYFNRTRDRDGHVFKGRYFARRVDDFIYLAMVVAYIDRNAVAAGIVSHPASYPHSSARHYVGSSRCPWLRRDIVEQLACRIARTTEFDAEAYGALWAACAPLGGDAMVSLSVRRPRVPVARIGRLLCSGPSYVQQWLLECARREEGLHGVALVIGALRFEQVEEGLPRELWMRGPRGQPIEMRKPMTAGLLRTTTGLTSGEIAVRMQVSRPLVDRWIALHREALMQDRTYANLTSTVVERALQRIYGELAQVNRLGDGEDSGVAIGAAEDRSRDRA